MAEANYIVPEQTRSPSPRGNQQIWGAGKDFSAGANLHVILITVQGEQPAVSAREYPDRMYVDVPMATKIVSVFVFMICALSLVTSFLTGFTLINRPFSILIGFFAIGFYVMARRLAQNCKLK